MSDELLPFYNRELTYIRRLAAQFAEANPKIAGRLRMGADVNEDPHVERLIEAFAYLTARVRHKIEDDFPEITESLLGVLYPHYQAPIPSLTIVQFELDPAQDELTAGVVLPRDTAMETEPIQGEPVRFRTCYPTTLWPIDVKAATLSRPPFSAPATPRAGEAAAVLRLVLACRGKKTTFGMLGLGSLRFFLKGQPQHVHPLYELIFNHVLEIALANAPDDPSPVLLDRTCLRPVGFQRDEGLLPYTARSFLGYRLLSEYFAFPQKFLFVDLTGLGPEALGRLGSRLEVYLYLNKEVPDLEQSLSADTFRLGCAPAVNLFAQHAEPIQLTHTEFEYRVVPDARRPLANEVYAVERVTATTPDGAATEFRPFFSVRHAEEERAATAYWYAARRPADPVEGLTDHGTEVYLSLVDLDFRPETPADSVLDVEITCLNRDLPQRLPFGGGQPRLQLSEGEALVSRVSCLTPPTRTLRPNLRRGTLWRLISHLALNHLSLIDQDDKALALRELLKLYDFANSAETRQLIDGLVGIRSRRVVGRAAGAVAGAFCQGVEVTAQLDPDRFTGSGMLLFASVLEHFFALYCSVNSFSKFVATVKGREGELRRWPPRAGEKVLA
jgi:type VI secretion system protein ImpG